MAILAKKINIQKGSIKEQVNLYNTLSEVGNANYINLEVDGVVVYAKYGATNDPRATNGRIDIRETTYALLSMAIPPYGIQTYTSSGSFTVPAGCTKLRVTCVGGGSGGATSGGAYASMPSGFISKAGGTSSIGVLLSSVGGGQAGSVPHDGDDKSRDPGAGGGNNGYADTGYGRGGRGEDHYETGCTGGSGGVNGASGQQGATRWVGGGGEDSPYEEFGGGGGGAGRSVRNIILNVSSGQVLPITIGYGGARAAYIYGKNNHTHGTSGLVIIEWGLGVE